MKKLMKIDYRVRCVIPYEIEPGVECQKLYYGIDAHELGDGEDVTNKFDHNSGAGRRVGRPAKLEKYGHFFNQRIL